MSDRRQSLPGQPTPKRRRTTSGPSSPASPREGNPGSDRSSRSSEPNTPPRRRSSRLSSRSRPGSASPTHPNGHNLSLNRLPPEIQTRINDIILPARLPVRLHSYGTPDLVFQSKVYLHGNTQDAQAWRDANSFRQLNTDFAGGITSQFLFAIHRQDSEIVVDMRGDAELLTFPDINRQERTDIVPIPDDLLNAFKRIKFIVPCRFS